MSNIPSAQHIHLYVHWRKIDLCITADTLVFARLEQRSIKWFAQNCGNDVLKPVPEALSCHYCLHVLPETR